MRILVVTPSYYPIVGGSEALTRTISIKLNRMGFQTDIMTLNMSSKWHPVWREEIESTGEFRIFRISAINPFNAFVSNPFQLLFRINAVPKPSFKKIFCQYDIIHFIGEADLSFPSFSYFVRKPKIMHCVATYFLLEYYKRHTLIRKPFRQLFLRLADLYVISSNQEKKLLSNLGVPSSKLHVLPIGVDVDTFHPSDRKRLDNLLLFVGRIDRIKGLHILLKALSYIKIPIQLLVIGAKWDPEYVKQIVRMSEKINSDDVHEVKLLPPMDQSDLISWYQKATIVVCPYLSEPYSNVTREALACGTPVVSTGKHIFERSCDGILISPKDPGKLASVITRLLQDKQMREKYGRQGRETVEGYLSWEPIIKDLSELYLDMLTGQKERSMG